MQSEPAISLPRVLIIDDDAISRDVLAMLLEMHGFPVESAEDGPHAVEMLEMWSGSDAGSMPGLILMDTQMPGISGVELIQLLRQLSAAPIVAISGSDPGVAIRAAANGFLLKPIQVEDVAAFVNNGLRRKSPAAGDDKPGEVSPDTVSEGVDTAFDPAINPLVLSKFKAMMPASAVREIYAAVTTDLKTRLQTLETAMNAGNLQEVQRIAHAIKGGCAMVGVTIASDTASRLEISNLPVTWPKELAKLRHALGALEGMLGGDFPA